MTFSGFKTAAPEGTPQTTPQTPPLAPAQPKVPLPDEGTRTWRERSGLWKREIGLRYERQQLDEGWASLDRDVALLVRHRRKLRAVPLTEEEEVEHAAVKADSERLDKQCQKLEMLEENWERAVRVQRRMSKAVSLPSLTSVATDSELGSGQDMLNDP